MCAKPYRQGVMEYGCGQCMPCRFNRRRVWVTRLLLERELHGESCVATLTYSDDFLPVDGSVSVRDARLFLKRLRQKIKPVKVRYYIVGEYGERGCRPHYHAVIFGISDPALVRAAWSFGHVYVDLVSREACSYVVSYVTKRMTGKEDVRLGGRAPEFARMSLKPGIGAGATEVISGALTSKGGSAYLAQSGDIPGSVRFDGRKWPLGRYLLRRVRSECGMGEDAGSALAAVKSWELQKELKVKGAREARELQRAGYAARIEKLVEISSSKKGTRL